MDVRLGWIRLQSALRSSRLTPVLSLSALIFSTSVAEIPAAYARTRVLPPPPPRHQADHSLDGTFQVSEWGISPQSRWSALEDEEGRSIDFNSSFRRSAQERGGRGNRRPAGLEVAQPGLDPREEGWKSTTVDDTRRISKGAFSSDGARPVLSRAPRNEVVGADEGIAPLLSGIEDPIARRRGEQQVSIIAGDLGFFPNTIFVSRDVPVRLFVTGVRKERSSRESLCIMMDSFNVRRQIRPNRIEEISFTPNQPGTYRYYCPVNGGEGTLVVKELSSDGIGG
jgi:hypothetical protein